MSDQLDIETAMRLARSLTTIEGFPRFEDAITATAADLVAWCQGAFIDGRPWSANSQASWLVSEARLTWRRWSGTGDFLALFRSKFPLKIKAGDEYSELGLKPPVLCGRCMDSFTVRRSDGWSEWCDCDGAAKCRQETPGWLDLVNKHLAPKPRLVRAEEPPLTAERVAAMKAEERRLIEQSVESAEHTIHDPLATKQQKKVARRLLKLYRPSQESAS